VRAGRSGPTARKGWHPRRRHEKTSILLSLSVSSRHRRQRQRQRQRRPRRRCRPPPALGRRSASPYADACGAGRRLARSRGQSRAARPRPDYPRARAARGLSDREDGPRHAACHRSLRASRGGPRDPCRGIDREITRVSASARRFRSTRRGLMRDSPTTPITPRSRGSARARARITPRASLRNGHDTARAGRQGAAGRGGAGGCGGERREERLGGDRARGTWGKLRPTSSSLRTNLFNGYRGCRATVALGWLVRVAQDRREPAPPFVLLLPLPLPFSVNASLSGFPVCVPVKEKERKRKRQKERDRERQRQRKSERGRDRGRRRKRERYGEEGSARRVPRAGSRIGAG